MKYKDLDNCVNYRLIQTCNKCYLYNCMLTLCNWAHLSL